MSKKMSSSQQILHEQGYCCCGQDAGTEIIACLCPKHGATVLNAGGSLEYPLSDSHAALHYACTGCTCRQTAGDDPACTVHKPPAQATPAQDTSKLILNALSAALDYIYDEFDPDEDIPDDTMSIIKLLEQAIEATKKDGNHG